MKIKSFRFYKWRSTFTEVPPHALLYALVTKLKIKRLRISYVSRMDALLITQLMMLVITVKRRLNYKLAISIQFSTFHNIEMKSNPLTDVISPFGDLIYFANVINNIDFNSLNESILKFMNSIESMCNLVCNLV